MEFFGKPQRFSAWVLAFVLALAFSASQAFAVPVIDGNGSDADWDSAIVQLDPANDVLPSPTASGYDLVEVRVLVDAPNNDMYFRLKTLGVPGDADGDLDPDNSSSPSIIDLPGVGGPETYQIFLDCDSNGVVDFQVWIIDNTPLIFDVQSGEPVFVSQNVTWAFGDGSDDAHKVVEIKVSANEVCPTFVAADGFSFGLQAYSGTPLDVGPEDLAPDSGFILIEPVPPLLVSSIDLQKTMTPDTAYTGENVTVTLVVTNDGETPLCDVAITDLLPNCLRLARDKRDHDDMDRDGIPDRLDDDDDGDGIPDSTDMDRDNDGINDHLERDADGDGISNKYDTDDDNDGILDDDDPDDNNDGILDVDDVDGDGIANQNDHDADDDSIDDNWDHDVNNDGLANEVGCVSAPEALVFAIGCLDPGQSETVEFEATVTCNTAQAINNTATAVGVPDGGDPVSDEDSATVDIFVPTPGLNIDKVKIGGPDTVQVSASTSTLFTLLITVTNTGNTDLTDVRVRDQIPYQLRGLNYIPSQGSVGTTPSAGRKCNKLGTDNIRWDVGTLAVGASATLQFDEQTLPNPACPYKYMPTEATPDFRLNKGAVAKAKDAVADKRVHDGPSLPVFITAVGSDSGICCSDGNDDNNSHRKQKNLKCNNKNGRK